MKPVDMPGGSVNGTGPLTAWSGIEALIKPEPWTADALCAQTDAEAFFPDKGGTTKPAKTICAACDVQAHCLEFAMRNKELFGIYGGLTVRERRKLARTRSAA